MARLCFRKRALYTEVYKDRDLKFYLFGVFYLVLTIFNEGAYLTFKSIFHKAINLFKFDCEFTLESVPGTNQY